MIKHNLFLPETTETYRRGESPFRPRNMRGPFDRKIILSDLSTGIRSDISSRVINVSVSYSLSMASELSFDIVDTDLDMSKNNYFILGRDVIYETQTLGRIDSKTGQIRQVSQLFEIANVSVSQGPGGSPSFSIKCYTKAIQQMKRDKSPSSIKGNGTQYIKAAAEKYGLLFYGEQTTKAKKINKTSGSKQSESLWNVMENLANDAKFLLFEVDGVLVFASEKFLLHKWGSNIRFVEKTTTDPVTKKKKTKRLSRRYITLRFTPKADRKNRNTPQYVRTQEDYFRLVEYPTITKSANDPYAADGSCTVERFNGTQIRPGMTAYVGDIPDMSGYYLIESVSYNEMVPDPVSVQFRTLTRDETKEKIKLLPIGKTYRQISISSEPIRTTEEAARLKSGKTSNSPSADQRIIKVLPSDEQVKALESEELNAWYEYPGMEYANISQKYSGFYKLSPASTGDLNCVIQTGNIDLWNRPIYVSTTLNGRKSIATLNSISYVIAAGSEYEAILLPTIFTENGQAVIKTENEVINKYNDDGGYGGFAKYLAVIRGSTKADAKANARDYGILLSRQQELMLIKRADGNIASLSNAPGGLDSEW